MTRETRVFVPLNGRFGHPHTWPNIAGYLIRPLTEMPCIQWYWFSRYVQPVTDADLYDCDPNNFPPEFYLHYQGQAHLVSTRFRYSLSCDTAVEFEVAAAEIFGGHSCIPRYFRDYVVVDDLGSGRFTAIDDRRPHRSELVREMVHATSRLVLHSLEEPDAAGNFRFEGIAFDVPHHLVSNITGKAG